MPKHRRLKYAAMLLALLAAGQGIDFLLAVLERFHRISGTITRIEKSAYYQPASRYSREAYVTKTVLRIGNSNREWYAADQTDADSLLQQLKPGDKVEIGVRNWFQLFAYRGLDANMFQVKKEGILIYDIAERCRRMSKIYMIMLGILAAWVYIIYLDVVKGISLERLYQKYILKNPDYMDR